MNVTLRYKLEDGRGFVSETVQNVPSTIEALTAKLDVFILAGTAPLYISAVAVSEENRG